MKKITFLVASIFLFGSSIANAAEKIDFSAVRKSQVDFRNDDPIVFVERGIEFYVFPDGQLDFNTRPTTSSGMYYKSKDRKGMNRTYGAPNDNRNGNYGVKVGHDSQGRVRQVGNVFLNYDVNDRVKRIGSVYMTYNRYALERVGGLEIIYNRRGQIVDIVGSVKGGRGYAYNQNSNQNYDYSYGNNQNTNDDDSYYYRTAGTKTKSEDSRLSGAVVINNR
jgi:hypothetical protein